MKNFIRKRLNPYTKFSNLFIFGVFEQKMCKCPLTVRLELPIILVTQRDGRQQK